jgi:hypothetical protein
VDEGKKGRGVGGKEPAVADQTRGGVGGDWRRAGREKIGKACGFYLTMEELFGPKQFLHISVTP